MPERFGCAMAQAGSFWWPGPEERLTEVVRAIPDPTSGVYLDVGTDEWSMADSVQRMAEALAARGDPLDVPQFCGGHDLACWRVGLANGLAAITARW